MKIPFLNIWVTRVNWETKIIASERAAYRFIVKLNETIIEQARKINSQSETYTDKSGRLRFKHNGQFAPDYRIKFKKVHDQLLAEAKKRESSETLLTGNYDQIKKASQLCTKN